VLIAPVGLAFASIHEAGASASVPFEALYAADSSHPSLAGSYLAANVILATIEKIDVEQLMPTDSPITESQARYLRQIAQMVASAERARMPADTALDAGP
jgi:hypothetical protein